MPEPGRLRLRAVVAQLSAARGSRALGRGEEDCSPTYPLALLCRHKPSSPNYLSMAASSVSMIGSVGGATGAKAASGTEGNVEAFLQPDFDAATYLNSALPSLAASSSTRSVQSTQHARSLPLPELSAQLQSFLSQLNAHTSRLSNSLTQLTDEIIRSGGRLAYEVDVLRAETIGLTESLEDRLKKDVQIFTSASASAAPPNHDLNGRAIEATAAETEQSYDTEHLHRLKILTSVRARLDSVIKVFGDAMEWPLAPSELSTVSSLISVSGPDAGQDNRTREEKGNAYAEKLRDEISDLIGSGEDAAATVRLEDLRRLAEVWKGTSEEKARLRLVENLARTVEEKQKAASRSSTSRPTALPGKATDYRYGDMSASNRPTTEGGYGFLQNLRNL